LNPPRPLDIAIVGMACRFPGAGDLFAYWENLVAGRDAIGDVPPGRRDPAGFLDSESTANDRVGCRRGGYLAVPIPFDPAEHGIMPNGVVDGGEPEQCLVLDAARAALADAGFVKGVPDGRRVEVVIGRSNNFTRGDLTRLQHGRIVAQTLAILRTLHPEWSRRDIEAVRADLRSSLPPSGPETIPGQGTNAAAGRIAGRFDLSGASYVVDAAGASSLVALDLGARALTGRRADLAIVGAVHLAGDVDFPLVGCQLGALSPTGVARPFGRDADGALPGEGVGVVVLKRLADAERDGDRVYAVIQGVGLAGDGRRPGPATPDARGHTRAIRRAYRRSGIDPATVGLIEGHGLGVPAADRAELRALRATFPPSRRRSLGAASALIGHAMPAAGMAGLIKAALALHHRVVPPMPDSGPVHPLLADDRSPAGLNPTARPWVHDGIDAPRRAGVNAFGVAGISAHAILEEHPASADGDTPGCQLRWDSEAILLGAPDRATWLDLARALDHWLDQGPDFALKDLAFTLNTGQPAFPFRVGMVVTSLADLKARLHFLAQRLADPGCRSIRDARGTYFQEEPTAGPGRLAFLFPGEGSQYPGMLADLCPHFPEVRALFDKADRIAHAHGNALRPSDQLFGGAGGGGLWTIGMAVNAVLSAQWGLYQLLSRLGLRPDVVAGHSSGEILAVAAAGALDVDAEFQDRIGGLGAIFERLESSGDVPAATLLAVAADRDTVRAACRAAGAEGLTLAMDNCPHQVVLAGPPEGVGLAEERLRGQGVLCERLPFARAYHTPAFATAIGPVREFFARLPLRRPRLPLYSCATAARVPDDAEAVRADAAEQWARPVRFRDMIEAMHADGARLFVEVGARGNLTGFVDDTLRGRPHFAVAANLPRRSGLTQVNHLVASLFAQGLAIRPDHLYARRRPERIDLAAAPRRPRPALALAVGFPELRISAELAESLRSRPGPGGRPSANGHVEPVDAGNGQSDPDGPAAAPHPRIVDPVEADPAMVAYLRTMDAFLETQREVMDAYLAAREPADWQPRPDSPRPAQGFTDRSLLAGRLDPVPAHEELSGMVGVPVARSRPPDRPPGSRSRDSSRSELSEFRVRTREGADDSVETILLERISQRTGYPREMIGRDLDLEGDLGIDSIKRVEILGDLRDRLAASADLDMDRLTRCRTLRQVVDALGELKPATFDTAPGPWVGSIRSLEPGRELVALRTLDPGDDPVAANHTLGSRRVSALDPSRKGLPVVPFAVMAEMLAEAGAALVPGGTLVALRDVQAHRWIKYEDDPVTLEIRARRVKTDPDAVRVEIFNRGTAASPRPEDGPVVDGLAIFAKIRPSAPEGLLLDLPDAGPCRFSAQELYADHWLFHGPAFQALTRVGVVAPTGIEGTLRVLPRRDLLRRADRGGLLTDVVILDAFTHLLGCWGLDRLAEGDVMFPLRMAELSLFGVDPPAGADVECRIAVRAVDRHRVRADAELVGPGGRVWMRIGGWEDWRFYWPGRYRDQFRQPDQFLLGEPMALRGDPAGFCAVWLEPPADMGRPVWRDVLEWDQLGPAERAECRALTGDDSRRTLRLWGRIAAKEAARRLWLEAGGAAIYPADLAIEPDEAGKPRLRSLAEPGQDDLPAVSIAHADGVAVALAALDPTARVGIDVMPIADRSPGFESVAFTPAELAFLDHLAGASAARAEWVARLWAAKEAAAKATGLGLVGGPTDVEIVEVTPDHGTVAVAPGATLRGSWPVAEGDAMRVHTERRGSYAWAWTRGDKHHGF